MENKVNEFLKSLSSEDIENLITQSLNSNEPLIHISNGVVDEQMGKLLFSFAHHLLIKYSEFLDK